MLKAPTLCGVIRFTYLNFEFLRQTCYFYDVNGQRESALIGRMAVSEN